MRQGEALRDAAKQTAKLRIATEDLSDAENDLARRRALRAAVAAATRETKLEERFKEEIRRLTAEGAALREVGEARDLAVASLRVLNKFKGLLEPTQEASIKALIAENMAIERQNTLLDEIRGPQIDFLQGQKDLTVLFNEGRISLAEFNKELRALQIAQLEPKTEFGAGLRRGILKLKEEISDVASLVDSAFENGFKGAADALTEFITTGKLSFGDLLDSITADITQIAVRIAILQPLIKGLFGGGDALGGLFGGLFGGGGGSDVNGAQHGADFTVRGSGGVDSQLVAFRATPGERVMVQTPTGGGPSQGPAVTIQFNVTTPDAESFGRSVGQLTSRALTAANRANRRNG